MIDRKGGKERKGKEFGNEGKVKKNNRKRTGKKRTSDPQINIFFLRTLDVYKQG